MSHVMNPVPFETGSGRDDLWQGVPVWLLDSSMAFSSVFIRVSSSAELIPHPFKKVKVT